MMDKRTLITVAVCMVALFGLQFAANKIYPPVPKKARVAATTIGVSNVAAKAVAATNAVTSAATTNSPAPVLTAPAGISTTNAPALPEKIVVLSNAVMRVEFTSRGGGIRSIELLQHKDSEHGHVLLNEGARLPALALVGSAETEFALEQAGPDRVVMRSGGVTKTVALGKDYTLTGGIEGIGADKVGVVVGAAGPTHGKEVALYLNADWQGGPKWSNRDLKTVMKRQEKKQNVEMIHARWVAVKSQYFAMVMTGGTNATAVSYEPVELTRTADWTSKEPRRGVTATAEWPVSGGKLTFDLYAGPKEYRRLAALGQQQEEVMDFGSWMDGYTGVFGIVLFHALAWSQKVVVNYGVAIILVTVLLKIVLWPVQAKSIQSMKAMQKFQPQMQKLREKYKDDSQRMNQEMMKLYKEHKINPFSGCLPMLVQMPVLIAFYKVLSNAIEMRGVPFLWIHDLSQPDTVAMIAGLAINPLPIIMVVSMIWQQKITPQTGDSQQQKMMMFMPLMMLFFFYTTASGLVLYWTVQQFLSIGQQWWSMRQQNSTTLVPAR